VVLCCAAPKMPAILRKGLSVAAGFVGRVGEPVERSTVPFDCNNDNLPCQLIWTDSAYELYSWDWTTSNRSLHWSLSLSDHPKITFVNGCGIGPKDNIVYCIVAYADVGHLGRLDGNGVAIVARTPAGGTSVSASFDEAGTFLADTGRQIWKIAAPHELKGWSEPTPDLPELDWVGKVDLFHGADSVIWREHLISVKNGNVIITNLTEGDLSTWQAMPNPADPMSGTFGGGYLYSGRLYFSANSGEGTYQIEPDLQARTFIGTRVGAAFRTSRNDGLNCIFTRSPDEAAADADSKDSGSQSSRLGAWLSILSMFEHTLYQAHLL